MLLVVVVSSQIEVNIVPLHDGYDFCTDAFVASIVTLLKNTTLEEAPVGSWDANRILVPGFSKKILGFSGIWYETQINVFKELLHPRKLQGCQGLKTILLLIPPSGEDERG